MSLKLQFVKYVLDFKFDAGTSRGVLKSKNSWFVKVYHSDSPSLFGIGEVSLIERLSLDYGVDFQSELERLKLAIAHHDVPDSEEGAFRIVNELIGKELPALRFALETALLDLINGGKRQIFNNGFFDQEKPILINGLIWMGDEDFMRRQIDEKTEAGFKCIKMKIGAIDFDKECELLRKIRSEYDQDQLTLRVDANGAFLTQDVLKKLEQLGEFDLHSIEQPIMPRQPHAMQLVCQKANIPVALDEDLIGVLDTPQREMLLDDIQPQFIVIKPSLVGGIQATRDWIKLAESRNIGWWITSALESNIGLNAISQLTAEYEVNMHQGLGTGLLYENNIHSPLTIKGEELYYHQNRTWDLSDLDFH